MDHRTLRARMRSELPPGLLAHIDRVVEIAARLAETHGLDVERTLLAAQGHDLCRARTPDELLAGAQARGLEIDPVERGEPVLLHGPLGALELAERFELSDERVLHAVRWHTSGHPEYDAEAWAMFVADKIDPHKIERWPALQEVRALADESLEAAALAYLDLSLARGEREGWEVHPMVLRAREVLTS